VLQKLGEFFDKENGEEDKENKNLNTEDDDNTEDNNNTEDDDNTEDNNNAEGGSRLLTRSLITSQSL
jgi:hypothetical protein